jgi:hypothetical protein
MSPDLAVRHAKAKSRISSAVGGGGGGGDEVLQEVACEEVGDDQASFVERLEDVRGEGGEAGDHMSEKVGTGSEDPADDSSKRGEEECESHREGVCRWVKGGCWGQDRKRRRQGQSL